MNRNLKCSLILLPVAVLLAVAPSLSARTQDMVTKTIYATFVDKDGKPVTDLKAEEIGIFEDGKQPPRTIVSLKPATTPLTIMMLADTTKTVSGTGLDRRSTSGASMGELIRDIRDSFSAFVTQMMTANPKNQLGLMEFGQAAIGITPFTSNAADLMNGVNKLVSKPDAKSVLLEAILDSSKQLSKAENARRAIVSINVEPSDEDSREPANNIMKVLATARAPLFAVSIQKGDLRNPSRGPILDGFTEKTGGRHDAIVGQSALVGMLKQYGDLLNAQYEITYQRPAGAPPQVLQMGLLRSGIKIYHSKFPPQ
jgi:hypothetical protein